MADQTDSEVELAAHPAGVAAHPLVGGVGEIETVKQLGRALSARTRSG